MAIDWTISFGNILTILVTLLGFGGGGILFVLAVRNDVNILASRLVPLEKAVLQLTSILVTLGRQDVRIDSLENQLQRDDARHQRR